MTIERLGAETPDITKQNIARLAELFPECVTEGPTGTASDRGEPVIDWDLLRQTLSDHLIEGPQERYRLDWPGKRQALLTANAQIDKTLRPMREDSVDFDTTRNLFIEGDNLDALKLLQETYLGKVKLIYIDPPYNTGKDFIYRDDFSRTRADYETASGLRDEGGGRLIANPETKGRFHSDWLSMMYPRLRLARNLLRDDGLIAVSIDDGEVSNLRKVLDEVFGEDRFIAQVIWKKRLGVSGANLQTGIDVEQVRSGSAFKEERTRYEHREQPVASKVRYDIIGQLAHLTRLTRATAGRILQEISPKTFALFGQNPEQFLRKAADLIRREKVRLAIESLRYEKTGERYDVSIFETDRHEISIERALQAASHVYDHVPVDSANERKFAERLEAAEEVTVYAKLPRGFTIPTPSGNYNPDWAIAIEQGVIRQIYFVAETKGSMLEEDLRETETQKIASAERYFGDVATNVMFRKIDSYDALMEAIT